MMKKFLIGLLKVIPVEVILRYIAKILTRQDDKIIDYVLEKVKEYDKKHNITGPEKREKVYKEVKEKFDYLADWVINFLIEMAVAYIRIIQQNQNKE